VVFSPVGNIHSVLPPDAIVLQTPPMADPELDIRSYRAADEQAVAALWAEAFPDMRVWNRPAEYIQRKLRVQGELFLVGALGERVVATVVAGYDGVRGWIYHLAVATEHRRRGVGRALMSAAEERLRGLGCAKINLQIYRSNAEVVRFYESIGWAVEDRISMGRRLD